MKIAVLRTDADRTQHASDLAAQFELPLIDLPADAKEFDYFFAYQDAKLVLQSVKAELDGKLCVDFSDAKLNYRANSAIRSQNIAKALGIKGEQRPRVLDATAGLGKDAFLIASLGCDVSLLERSPLVHALLSDGLSRQGCYSSETLAILARMTLRLADVLDLSAEPREFDVVYLDPMFPQRRKSAKVKKDMALLQQLLGHQSDGDELLAHARRLAKKRVVVKRAKLSPQLGPDKPDIQFKGSSSRYDVYLQN
jgi:16S rRNA (guanine1516-N2)-methyltransferase